MLIHLFLNSILVFFLLCCFIEFLLKIFNVQNYRVRYVCRLLPIIKLPLDLALFTFFNESFFINLNPLSCEFYTQDFLQLLFPPLYYQQVSSFLHLIIPSYFASYLPVTFLNALFIIFCFISLFLIILHTSTFFFANLKLCNILKKSFPYDRLIKNSALKKNLYHVSLRCSDNISIPFAAFNKYILVPTHLIDSLTEDEFEAILAHELEHLKWKDPFLKLFYSCISSLCWWIPTRSWCKKLELEQEKACDSCLKNYQMDSQDLASAYLKTLKLSKADNLSPSLCYLNENEYFHKDRLHSLLNEGNSTWSYSYVICIGLGLLSLFSFYMC